MDEPLVFPAPAKINLYLHVTGKRHDGFHLLDSLVTFADKIADTITITAGKRFSFTISGPFEEEFSGEDLREDKHSKNLIVKAAYMFQRLTGVDLNINIHLEKNIPMGAGIGGGSADAAATVKALEKFYGTPLPRKNEMLLNLGADVPVCYHGKTCRFEGIGEDISEVPPFPSFHMLLVWPNEKSPTKGVFKAYHGRFSREANMPDDYSDIRDFIGFIKNTRNDLSEASRSLYPVIEKAEEILWNQPKCFLARMSGSGTSVFGLFEKEEDCRAAKEAVTAKYPDWWVQTAKIA